MHVWPWTKASVAGGSNGTDGRYRRAAVGRPVGDRAVIWPNVAVPSWWWVWGGWGVWGRDGCRTDVLLLQIGRCFHVVSEELHQWVEGDTAWLELAPATRAEPLSQQRISGSKMQFGTGEVCVFGKSEEIHLTVGVLP